MKSIDVEAEFEHQFDGIDDGLGQRLSGHRRTGHYRLVGRAFGSYGLKRYGGFEEVCFH